MSKQPKVAKKDRPKAIENILRDGRARDPGTWVTWHDILEAVGGSERDLPAMIRAAKERILAEEAATAQLPELPGEMRSECERFVLEMWRKSCELNDANASAERRARQADRERWEEERMEHDEVISALADERDRLNEQVRACHEALEERAAELAAKEELLNEERRLRAAAEAASNELRQLFESLRVPAAFDKNDVVSDGQFASGDPGTTTPKSTRNPPEGKGTKGAGSSKDEGPETPPLPMK